MRAEQKRARSQGAAPAPTAKRRLHSVAEEAEAVQGLEALHGSAADDLDRQNREAQRWHSE